MREVSLVLWNDPYSGAMPPESLSRDELESFLTDELPLPSEVAPDATFVGVVEDVTGRTVVWSREAGTDALRDVGSLKQLTYREAFRGNRGVTVRDGLGVLLGATISGSLNQPVGVDYQFRDFILVTRRHILVISLPVAPYSDDPPGLFESSGAAKP